MSIFVRGDGSTVIRTNRLTRMNRPVKYPPDYGNRCRWKMCGAVFVFAFAGFTVACVGLIDGVLVRSLAIIGSLVISGLHAISELVIVIGSRSGGGGRSMETMLEIGECQKTGEKKL